MRAQEILAKNGIDYKTFAKTLKISLEKGRKKHLHIMLHDPADCGKIFLHKPVCSLFPNVFMNPASSRFGWMGVEKSNLIFLNDLRWAPRDSQGGNIDWQFFQNLLEGQTVLLPTPMYTNSSHIRVTKLMPIFATSIDEIRYWGKTFSEAQMPRHIGENAMMA